MSDDPRLERLAERLGDSKELNRFLLAFANRSLIAQTSAHYFLELQLSLLKLRLQGTDDIPAAHARAAERTMQMVEIYKDVYGEDAWPSMRAMLEEVVEAGRPSDSHADGA